MIGTKNRFHGRGGLRFVYQNGKTLRSSTVLLKYALNEKRRSYRCAVVVSRKVSRSAVVRNRIRRRVYEIVRRLSADITKPHDMVFTILSEQVAMLPANELEKTIHDQLKTAHIIQRKPKFTEKP